MAIFVILFFGFIACLWLRTWNLTVKPAVQELQRNKMYDKARYDKETFTLHLYCRGPEIASHFKIKDDKNLEISYRPLQVHVGTASVGGVTTGGVYTTGDYHYVSGEHKNGLCRLEYTGEILVRIQLSDELYKDAKKSSIQKYLNADKQIEVIQPKARSYEEIKLAHHLMTTTGYAGNDYYKKGYPTYQKCKEILDWIADDIGTIERLMKM